MKISTFLLASLLVMGHVWGQTIAEKKASLMSGGNDLSPDTEQVLADVNRDTQELHTILRNLYQEARELYHRQAAECEYQALLTLIQQTRQRLDNVQTAWRERATREGQSSYGLWQQPETTLEQLIIDYGASDYVYLIPPEIGAVKVSVDSQLPVPRSSWNDMLEIILYQNGVGVRQLNPYLREVFFLQDNPGGVQLITNRRQELAAYPPDARVVFVLTPEGAELRRAKEFVEKFRNPLTTQLYSSGGDLLIVGLVADILDILKLYCFVEMNKGETEYKVIPLRKVPAEEMIKILNATFDRGESSQNAEEGLSIDGESHGLRVVQLSYMHQALFLAGSREEMKRAEDVIRDVEKNLSGGREKVLYRYEVRHSDPEMLADVLAKVYALMMTTGFQAGYGEEDLAGDVLQTNINVTQEEPRLSTDEIYSENFYQSGSDIVNPAPIEPGKPKKLEDPNKDRINFIVDLKTSSLVMVVEADLLPRIKELLTKLDVPKKMVQIETLLFEKKMRHQNDFGMNLLRIGDAASNTHQQGARWNDLSFDIAQRGVFQYFISRMKDACGVPAFDLSFRFLLAQDDVSINSAPSVVAINNTPATIAIEDEISINTGIFAVDTVGGVTLKDAFTRAQYGITIVITPTIHLAGEEDADGDYVTLETDITFDTIQRGTNPERPDVTRRHITNYVSIPDGQTVIIGGLRRKRSEDVKEKIPFLGDLPGIGKFFGTTTMEDENTEMFLFITPKIITDPVDDFRRLRTEQLCHRPGDIPSFLANLNEARRLEKEQLFEDTLTALFGRGCDLYYVPEGEYDGR